MDFKLVKGVVVTGRLTDRATGRPGSGLGWLRRDARQSRTGPACRAFRVPFSTTSTARAPAATFRRWPTAASASSRFRAKGSWSRTSSINPTGSCPRVFPTSGSRAPRPMPSTPTTTPCRSSCSRRNFPAVTADRHRPRNRVITCDLTSDSGVVRTGTVCDPEGRPLSGTTAWSARRGRISFDSPRWTGPNFTVYGLFRDPKLYRTVIFRHAESGLGTTLRIDGSDPGPINVRLEPMASLDRPASRGVGGNPARMSSCGCCGSLRSHTSAPTANSHHRCERRPTGTAGSASTASYRALPTGSRHPKAGSSTATSGRPGPASRRISATPRSNAAS